MARRPIRSSGLLGSPVQAVALIALAGLVVHVAVVWVLERAAPSAYGLGQTLGTHLAAFLITALIATLARLGSFGSMVAVYLLTFVILMVLLAFANA